MHKEDNLLNDGEFLGRGGATFLAYDRDWQSPAITEQWAFNRALELLPRRIGFVYIAFPWATLIDILQTNQYSDHLLAALDRIKSKINGYTRVTTVCQHILLHKYLDLFESYGITDVFWSHMHSGQPFESEVTSIKLHPFPLYPVNSPGLAALSAPKRHNFSFIGATSNQNYIDDAREIIAEELSSSPFSLVRMRNKWHYQEAVYDYQILKQVSQFQDPLCTPEAQEHREALASSHFVLCPSGSGANSLRLWEAIDCGTIPVILSPSYVRPGNPLIWEQATLSFGTSRAEISRIPKTISGLIENIDRMESYKSGIRQIRLLYGKEIFIHDIIIMYTQVKRDISLNKGKLGRMLGSLANWVGSSLRQSCGIQLSSRERDAPARHKLLPYDGSWAVISGVDNPEGPFPSMGIDSVCYWTIDKTAVVAVFSSIAGRRRLSLALRGMIPGQKVGVRVNGNHAIAKSLRGTFPRPEMLSIEHNFDVGPCRIEIELDHLLVTPEGRSLGVLLSEVKFWVAPPRSSWLSKAVRAALKPIQSAAR